MHHAYSVCVHSVEGWNQMSSMFICDAILTFDMYSVYVFRFDSRTQTDQACAAVY